MTAGGEPPRGDYYEEPPYPPPNQSAGYGGPPPQPPQYEKESFDQVFRIEKPKYNDLWAGILVRMDRG